MKNYPKPQVGEQKYVDYDEATALYCVFGLESGHAYSSWATEEQAKKALAEEKQYRRTGDNPAPGV